MSGEVSKTPMEAVEMTDKQTQAVALARQGKSYDEIAAALGWKTRSGAYQAVQAVLGRADYAAADGLRNSQGLEIDYYNSQFRSRFDELWALGVPATDAACKVLDRIVRLMERRARLFGLDAPIRVDATVSDATDKAIAELADQLGMPAKVEEAPTES